MRLEYNENQEKELRITEIEAILENDLYENEVEEHCLEIELQFLQGNKNTYDGLHQKAGSKNVFEIHGSTSRNYCVKCGAEYPVDYIFESDGIPICPKCNRPVRPDVVLYGEKLPMDTLYKATTAISKADCLIVGGTSLQVWPAAGIVSYFKGDYMVVINKDHLPIGLGDGDLQINDSLGNVFREIKKYI